MPGVAAEAIPHKTTENKDKEAPKEEVKPVTLNLAHFWPASHSMETISYPAGTLIPAAETYDSVVKGVADIGISVFAYNRGRFPVVETFLVPGITFNNFESASAALMEGIEKFDPQELKDTHLLMSFAAGPGDLFTKKPIRKMADLKGLQIGATAGLRADAIGLLGATPIVQPMSEWYESLSNPDPGKCS